MEDVLELICGVISTLIDASHMGNSAKTWLKTILIFVLLQGITALFVIMTISLYKKDGDWISAAILSGVWEIGAVVLTIVGHKWDWVF